MTGRLDKAERKVLSALENVDLEGDYSDRHWTTLVLKALGALGVKEGHSVCASGLAKEFDCGEWLCDMVWYKENSVGLDAVPLALECEWSRTLDGIQFDFEKLLVCRASHRVMMYGCPQRKRDEYAAKLFDIVTKFGLSQAGDRYLLVAVDSKDGELHEYQFTYGGR